MKMRNLLLATLFAACACAADKPAEPIPTVQPDQGYVLMRAFKGRIGSYGATIRYTPVLVRILSPEEIARAKDGHAKNDANVVIPDTDQAYGRDNDSFVLFTPLKPGTYVLAGVAHTSWSLTQVVSSLCMGTVKFDVKPGVVTDLGTLFAVDPNEPTDIPELKNVVAGKDIGMAVAVKDVAIRPVSPQTETPDKFKSLPTVAADYHAVGWLPNYLSAGLSRLAPMDGVIAYDNDGNAIDLKTAAKP